MMKTKKKEKRNNKLLKINVIPEITLTLFNDLQKTDMSKSPG